MSATDEPMAHSTRLMLAAGASGGLG
ncbi:MAG: hypothetical protein JWN04_6683, partial [Myxococcaceae bacterium]|nr:hypothetical protein [Myxococcaceae bacterium]